jgi:hypothetical protein
LGCTADHVRRGGHEIYRVTEVVAALKRRLIYLTKKSRIGPVCQSLMNPTANEPIMIRALAQRVLDLVRVAIDELVGTGVDLDTAQEIGANATTVALANLCYATGLLLKLSPFSRKPSA